ncbi:hypothetical protein HAX54_026573 [Datura stramonium]|uniref:Uncharacterized protein n=1 Tax=Datura stramonium TaxID=4076 RepID=A0ABS8V1D7_DATST|nr:hypothetical protein [Datura stramonium]
MGVSLPLEFLVTRHKPELVVPATKTPHERKYLSDLDDQGSLRLQIPILFFYKYNIINPSLVEVINNYNRDPAKVIKEGLSKTLVFYYPLAGRIVELGDNKKLVVDCNGEGILFAEADAHVELDKLGDNIKPPCPYLDQLLYNVPGSDGILGCPLLLVQVTRFSCGGFAVGFKFNHTMMDAYGMKLFFNALTELIQGASTPIILPVWQRDLFSARSSPCITCTHHEFDINEHVSNINAWDDSKLIQHSFFFGNKEIEAIRDQVAPSYRAISTKFELLVAFLWKCRTIALDLEPEETVRLTYLVNVRGKALKFDVPLGYYGNGMVSPAAVSKAGLLCSSPLTYAVELVKSVKDHMNEEYIRSVADLMVIKGRPELSKSWNFIVSDNRSAGFDEVDFGWGNPIFGGVPIAISFISFCVPIKNNMGEKGILVAINLPQLAMEKFQEVVYKTTFKNVE